MIWQDAVILVGQLVLFITLIPTIVSKVRVPLLTSLPAMFVLDSFIIVFTTLGMWGSVVTSALNAAAWALIAFNAMDDDVAEVNDGIDF